MTIYQDYKVTYRDGSTNVFTGDSLASAALQAIAHGNPVCFEPICTRCHEAIRAGTTLEIEAGRYVHPACAVEGGLA
ncbi:MAG TPA: hypothetical protein PLR44_14625 [Thermomicrobiales bacterium]|jgi:hypothetical protein|nr:hypothetical protein [Thermomicrobiales bacterium]HRA33083.1 hypothetical protein [Thermomicrobiales bacterium]